MELLIELVVGAVVIVGLYYLAKKAGIVDKLAAKLKNLK